MRSVIRLSLLAASALLLAAGARAQDWPQWRGPNRDAKAAGFTAPKSWPKELTKKWKVSVGDGVATPALVGDKLYVFTREGGDEVIRCLDAASSKEVWKDSYAAKPVTGPAGGFPGPRASPTVADGKVVTFGASGHLSCYTTDGKKLWAKDDFSDKLPRFFVSSSPIVIGDLCIVQLGGEDKGGGIFAYDMASGDQKWKWTDDGSAYASPNLLVVDGIKAVVAMTNRRVVALNAADSKLLWDTGFDASQRMSYNSSTPIVDGTTLIFSGNRRGTKAFKFEKQGDGLAAKELWSNPDTSVVYNTPVVKEGVVYGLSEKNDLFAINAESGKTSWTAPAPAGGGGGMRPGGPPGGARPPGGGGAPGGGRPGGRPGGMMGQTGYGSVVDAGSVLFALTPAAQLIVFEPTGEKYKQIASYKVADGGTYAYPVISGNRIFIKDKDSLALWTIE
jgi:outer membrane protein assembly factor BamB